MEVTSLQARSSRSVIGCKNARTVRSPSAVSTVSILIHIAPTCRPQSVILSLPESKNRPGTAKGAISRSAVRRRLSAKAQLSAAPRIRTDTLPAVKPDTPFTAPRRRQVRGGGEGHGAGERLAAVLRRHSRPQPLLHCCSAA